MIYIYIFVSFIILCLAGLFLLAPGHQGKDAERLKAYRYAHRGLFDPVKSPAENSFQAFEAAVDAGCGMEMDVQLSGGGTVVITHDRTALRLFGDPRAIAAMKDEELTFLPTLEHTLAMVAGRVPLIIELKPYGRRGELCRKTLALLSDYKGIYSIESFDPLIVRWFKRRAPQVIRGQLMGKQSVLFLNFIGRPHFLACQVRMANGLLFRLVKRLYHPITAAWTIRTRDEEFAAKRDFDLVIFEQERE
ncbi:MAG: hypothetical protein FWF47_02330 [Clostridia bacterium]|nr:hypothetical protein [Clostridia bacterium]